MKIALFFIFLFLSYIVIIFNPGWYFGKKAEYENIILGHRLNETYDFNSLLDGVNSTLKKSKIYKQEYSFNIYITKNNKEFIFFAPFCRKKRYCINPIINAAYISPVKVENGKIIFEGDYKYEPFAEIKKAAVQSLILQSETPLSFLMIDEWKKIGYAEYEVDEFPAYMNSDLCRSIEDSLYKEFENRMCVKYMLEGMNLPVDEMLRGNYSYNYILEQARIKYCQR